MNTSIPAGSRAGARPCGSTWGGFGGYGSTQYVYCEKCIKAWELNNGDDPRTVFA